MFKIQKLHLDRLAVAVKTYGRIHLHGDGNMYIDRENENGEQSDSDFHKEFSDPKNVAATYVLTFDRKSKLPKSVEEVEKLFLEAKSKEEYAKNTPKEVVNFVGLPKEEKAEEPEGDDIEL